MRLIIHLMVMMMTYYVKMIVGTIYVCVCVYVCLYDFNCIVRLQFIIGGVCVHSFQLHHF